MSTDWGYGCETCGVRDDGSFRVKCIIDNYRDPEELGRLLSEHLLSSMAEVSKAGFYLTRDHDSHVHGFGYAAEFVVEHRALGHTVVVCDEYGRKYGRCPHWVKCGECLSQKHCVLPCNHDGPHASTEPGAKP